MFEALRLLAFGEGTEAEEVLYQEILSHAELRGLEKDVETFLRNPDKALERCQPISLPKRPWLKADSGAIGVQLSSPEFDFIPRDPRDKSLSSRVARGFKAAAKTLSENPLRSSGDMINLASTIRENFPANQERADASAPYERLCLQREDDER